MNINDVHEGIQKYKKRKRIGRGPGSGHGKTAGRGHKGQQSRAGHSRPVRLSMPGRPRTFLTTSEVRLSAESLGLASILGLSDLRTCSFE